MKITPKQAHEMLSSKNNYILLDVRTDSEYAEEHLPNAIVIPLEELPQRAKKELPDKSQPIIIYCHSGSRSLEAEILLETAGYKNIFNMGGIEDWKKCFPINNHL